MPSGHTERATINERRPMTPGMVDLLRRIEASPVGRIPMKSFVKAQAEKAQARALMDRGYALPDPAGWWEMTDAGRAALSALAEL